MMIIIMTITITITTTTTTTTIIIIIITTTTVFYVARSVHFWSLKPTINTTNIFASCPKSGAGPGKLETCSITHCSKRKSFCHD